MKKAVILFLVASCLMGCKRSTEYLDDAPEAADNEDLEAEQEERVLREAPLGDEKEIRCDIDFGTYSQELMTRKSRKPAIYRFSKNQIKKNICSGYYQFFYGTDSFDVDCYEIKSGYDSK
ncbi:MAG: hypothetical protein IJU23_07250, partial [Proteobacteria bacterium]|nr:hypothetical protein [Pseudomonadota bacterium]